MDLTNQLSMQLGLTEQQRKQFAPILKDELKQLGDLKKDTSLSALKKVARLREIGTSFDAKMKPLLNPDQQQKFDTLREDARRKLIETMGSEALKKAEAGLKASVLGVADVHK
jgi:Spy/CpxP family protein refolding chaperone